MDWKLLTRYELLTLKDHINEIWLIYYLCFVFRVNKPV